MSIFSNIYLLKEVAFSGNFFYFWVMCNIQKRAKRTIYLFLFIFYCYQSTFIYGQENFELKIINVAGKVAHINGGISYGLRDVELLIVKRPVDTGYLHVGVAITVQVLEKQAIIELIENDEKSEFRVGDLIFRTEEEFLRKTEGFQRWCWGTDRSRIHGLVYIFTDSLNTDLRYYGLTEDELTCVGAEISDILYGFRGDKFCSVVMSFKGIDHFFKLFYYCVEAFGEMEKIGADINGYEWSGVRSVRRLIYNTESEKGLMVWRVKEGGGE